MFSPYTWVAGLAALTVLFGYFFPASIPGKFVHATLATLGLGGDRYKERTALGGLHAALDRKEAVVRRGVVDGGGQSAAHLGSLRRERAGVAEDVRTYNARLDRLDADHVPDDDPVKVEVASDLMEAEARLKAIDADIVRLEQSRQSITTRLREGARQVGRGRRDARRLEAELRTSEVERDLAALDGQVGGAGHDTEERARELLQARIDGNRGSAQAMTEVFGAGDQMAALDRKVRDGRAAEFLAARRGGGATTPTAE